MHETRLLKKLEATLDRERFEHTLRVKEIALALGKKYRVNLTNITQAALLHDCARRWDRKGLLKKAKELGLEIDPISRLEPKLFHAAISAWLARTEFGVSSPAVLQAIRHHTVGSPRMTKLDKIIYLADHIEEGREFRGVAAVRKLAFRDLDQAIALSTGITLRYLLDNDLPIYPGTILTRHRFLLGK